VAVNIQKKAGTVCSTHLFFGKCLRVGLFIGSLQPLILPQPPLFIWRNVPFKTSGATIQVCVAGFEVSWQLTKTGVVDS
jgi:hypothetical protein